MTRGDVLRGWLFRPALLLLWSLVLWGTLLLGIALADAFGEGFGVVLGRLVPARGASLWAWLNAASAALALVVWPTIAALVASRLRHRGEA